MGIDNTMKTGLSPWEGKVTCVLRISQGIYAPCLTD
jgi:hypothetical protein